MSQALNVTQFPTHRARAGNVTQPERPLPRRLPVFQSIAIVILANAAFWYATARALAFLMDG